MYRAIEEYTGTYRGEYIGICRAILGYVYIYIYIYVHPVTSPLPCSRTGSGSC